MDVVVAFPAGAQAAEAVVPGDGAFHDPSSGAEAGAMWLTAAGDTSADSLGAQQSAVFVMVVGPVGVDDSGPMMGRPRLPAMAGIASMSGRSWVMSWWLPPVSDAANGIPPASVIMWCLGPGRPRSTGRSLLGLVSEPAHARRRSTPGTNPGCRPRAIE